MSGRPYKQTKDLYDTNIGISNPGYTNSDRKSFDKTSFSSSQFEDFLEDDDFLWKKPVDGHLEVGLYFICLNPGWSLLMQPEPGRPDCEIYIQKGVRGDAYPVSISQKVTKNLPIFFYSPSPGFKRFVKF